MNLDNFWLAIYKKALSALLGGNIFEVVKNLVKGYMDDDIPGADKKKAIKKQIMPLLSAVGKLILSSAITFAVDSLRAEIAKREMEAGK